MDLIVFDNEAYKKLRQELMLEFQAALEAAYKRASVTSTSDKDWLSTQEAKELLGVKSKSKMQNLRDHGVIKFSQHGRIIKYSKKSILEFLEQHTKQL